MNGAAIVTETLRRAGVSTVFSLSGNQIMPVYDASIDSGLRIVHTRHEAAAVYMADAWGQITGDLGVALVTAGPGFANAISALYTARMAESPVLYLSGDAPVAGDGNGAFQEMNQTAISAPAVKYAARPRTAEELAHMLPEAIRIARSGRPGPVHVALPADVLLAEAQVLDGNFEPELQALADEVRDAVLERFSSAKRPLILTGPALSDSRAHDALSALRAATGAPVIPLESPRGLRDPALGAFAAILREADLILSIGKFPDFAAGLMRPPAVAETTDVIVLDPEQAALDRAAHLCGERLVLAALADARTAARALADFTQPVERHGWSDRVGAALAHRVETSDAGGRIHARQVGEAVQHLLDEANDPILICDGGEFGQWIQAVCTAPTRLINGLSGAIGGCLPYAVAASIARPDATVIALMGDGTAGFHVAEFETAAREGVRFLALIGNDARWNAEHQIQIRDFGADRTVGCDLLETARYDRAAEAFGCRGIHADTPETLDAALRDAIASDKPVCLDIPIASLAAPAYAPFTGESD